MFFLGHGVDNLEMCTVTAAAILLFPGFD